MGKVIFIADGASSVGRAIGKKMIADRNCVYAGAQSGTTSKLLRDLGSRAVPIDFEDDASMIQAVKRVHDDAGQIDVLINNVVYASFGALEDVPLNEVYHQFSVNVFGMARLTQLVIPIMRNHGRGRIINLTSTGGMTHEPLGCWYHAAKFALEGLSDCLRMELRPFGIDVVVMEYGAMDLDHDKEAGEVMLRYSGTGVYRNQANSQSSIFRNGSISGKTTEQVVKAVSIAMRAPQPKARYVIGNAAKMISFFHWVLSDRIYDRFIAAMTIKKTKHRASA
jgi:NAD(P)-dependent dehydrogenase (short-subunit alcohol dehydrogenase family)